MQITRHFGTRWIAPAILSAAALAVLVAVPVIAGPKVVTTQSLKQQSNAKYIHVNGPIDVDDDLNFDYDSPQVVLPLPKGNYLLQATFTLNKLGADGLVPICRLGTKVNGGSKFDWVDAWSIKDKGVIALNSAAKLKGNGTAKLACADGSVDNDDSTISSIDITAIEVPALQAAFL